MQKRFIVLSVFVSCAVLFLSLSCLNAGEGESQAKLEINQVIAKINTAWKSADQARLMREVMSDKSYAMALPNPQNPATALILNKENFCQSFEKLIREQPPKNHEHQVKTITVIGPLAYEIGFSKNTDAQGKTRTDEVMNVFAKDETGWRLIFSTPAENVRKALSPGK